MRKIAILIPILILVILLSGCTDSEYKQPEKIGGAATPTSSNGEASVTSPQEEPSQPAPPAVTTFSIGETSSDGVLNITVNSVSYQDVVGDNEYFKAEAKEGKTFAIVDITMENTSTEKERSYSALTLASVFDEDGYKYDFDFMATSQLENDLSGGEILPTRKVRGQLAFEVPKDAKSLELEIDFEIFSGTTAVYKLK